MKTITGAAGALCVGAMLVGSCGGKAVVDSLGGGGSAAGGTTSRSGTCGSSASSGTTGLCPPVPLCNWCGGTPVVDGQGCVIGYKCANGADPCVTQPCANNSDCEPGSYCAPDGLCWPCEGGPCEIGGTYPNMTCSCSGWCENGMDISFECSTSEWGGNCDCLVAGVLVGVCDFDGPPGDPCTMGFNCCDWPSSDDG